MLEKENEFVKNGSAQYTQNAVADYLFKYKAISNLIIGIIGNFFLCVWITIIICWYLFGGSK